MTDEENKIKIYFTAKVTSIGSGESTLAIVLPPEIVDYLEIVKDDELKLMPDISRHGKFCSVWSQKNQDKYKKELAEKTE